MTTHRAGRRIGTVALVVGVVVAGAPGMQAQAAKGPLRGTIERFTSVVYESGTPVAEPATAPAVNVFATVRGCTPGEFFVAHFTVVQDGLELTNTAGMSPGAGEQRCGQDGTARISEPQLGLFDANVPHPGAARATLHIWDTSHANGVLIASRTVVVPGS